MYGCTEAHKDSKGGQAVQAYPLSEAKEREGRGLGPLPGGGNSQEGKKRKNMKSKVCSALQTSLLAEKDLSLIVPS